MSLFELQRAAGPSAQREHIEIVTAAASGDAKGAAQAMARHRDSTLAAWRTALAELAATRR